MSYLPDKDTGATYQALAKQNYINLPPANAEWDWDNTLIAPMMCNVAGLGLSAPRAGFRLMLASSTAGMTLLSWNAVWQNCTPTTPIIARTGAGVFTVTFPTSVSDEYNASLGITNTHTVQFGRATASLEGSTFGLVNVSAVGNVITINTANTSGTPNDLVGSVVSVSVFY
jgi:hypothetical protein